MNNAKTTICSTKIITETVAFFTPYIRRIIKKINIIPTNAATRAPFNAFTHNVGLIFSSCININGAGNAHSFNESTSSFADCGVKLPSICALHQHIFDWIVGAVSNFPPINIAICFPILTSEMLQKSSVHFSSRLITTTGSPTCDELVFAYLKYAPLSTLFSLVSTANVHVSLSCTNTSSMS